MILVFRCCTSCRSNPSLLPWRLYHERKFIMGLMQHLNRYFTQYGTVCYCEKQISILTVSVEKLIWIFPFLSFRLFPSFNTSFCCFTESEAFPFEELIFCSRWEEQICHMLNFYKHACSHIFSFKASVETSPMISCRK